VKITANEADVSPTQPIPHWGLHTGFSLMVIYRIQIFCIPGLPRFLLQCNVVNSLSCCSLKCSILGPCRLGGSFMLPILSLAWLGLIIVYEGSEQHVGINVCESGWSWALSRQPCRKLI